MTSIDDLIAVLEHHMGAGDEAVQNVIAVSFLFGTPGACFAARL